MVIIYKASFPEIYGMSGMKEHGRQKIFRAHYGQTGMKENFSARLAASARQRRDYPETVFSCAGKMPFLPILS